MLLATSSIPTSPGTFTVPAALGSKTIHPFSDFLLPWTLPHLTKAVHTPKLLMLLYEVNAMYRQIFIDGRPQPNDPTPAWNGYSTAHWEGDTLLVQTEGFRDGLWIDTWGSPMSDAAKMTEKMRRPNFGTLEIELTIGDPKVYTKPFTVNLTESLEADTEEYLSRREELRLAEIELRNQRERVAELRRKLPKGPAVQDYIFEEVAASLDSGDSPV
jgi:hypothetical protein